MNYKNKNFLIVGLISIIIVMVVGYAAFATQLQINGTATITSSWDVHIESITPGTPVGTATSTEAEVGLDKLSATFHTNLVAPGDSLTYTVVVKNDGTIDAKLNNLVFTPGDNMAINYSYSGIAVGNVVDAGDTLNFTVTVTYNSAVTEQPLNTTNTLSMVLTFIQNN